MRKLRVLAALAFVGLAADQAICSSVAFAAENANRKPSARELLQTCLAGPDQKGITQLAEALGATPYSVARKKRELDHHSTSTIVDDATRPTEAQRTETSVTAFAGWDLPGSTAGSLEYSEGTYQTARVELPSGQLLTQWRAARTRDCQIAAPVNSIRAIFQLYESLQKLDYGVLISADLRSITMFSFEPEHYDIELHLKLDRPVPGLATSKPADATHNGLSRLIVTDGGGLAADDPPPGVPFVKIKRAALLSALEQPGDMIFGNEVMEPQVQRLSMGQ